MYLIRSKQTPRKEKRDTDKIYLIYQYFIPDNDIRKNEYIRTESNVVQRTESTKSVGKGEVRY